MDKITIKNINIFAYHGVFDEEKENGQLFRVSAELFLSVRKAAQKDDLRLAVNYADVASLIEKVVTREKCDLIETVAENVAAEILIKYKTVHGVKVKVSKPNAPIDMEFEDVSVEVNRSRHTVLLGLGSNLGDREKYLRNAIDQLGKDDYINVLKVSSIIETEPYGPVEQPDYLNAAVLVETLYTPHQLHKLTSQAEQNADRVRTVHWGPRTLDIDIILFDDIMMHDETLTIPHIDMANREFVLAPLCELDPYAFNPATGKTAAAMLAELKR